MYNRDTCPYITEGACGFAKTHSCDDICDLRNLPLNAESLETKALLELNFLIKYWGKKEQKVLKDKAYGFVLLSGLLYKKFGIDIRKRLNNKQLTFVLRMNILKFLNENK